MRKTFSLPVAATAAGGGPTPPPADTVDNIEHSVRFNSADSAYLSRTPSSAGNRKTWTWSGWVKIGKLGTRRCVFGSTLAGNDYTILEFNATDNLVYYETGASGGTSRVTTAVYRDPSAWYHIVLAVDTTQGTAPNRQKLYVNGVEVTDFSTAVDISQDYNTRINDTISHDIGREGSFGYHWDGYQANIHFIDGLQLTPSSFGFTDSNGVWQPKAFTGSYGTNGFHLDFADTSSATALGNDVSGNNNDFTPSGLVAGPAYTANSFSTEFDGTGDRLSIADSADFTFGTGDYTMEAWIYPTSLTSYPLITAQYENSAGNASWFFSLGSNTTTVKYYAYGPNGDLSPNLSGGTAPLNTWTHVAVTRSGSTVRLFVNGSQVDSRTWSYPHRDSSLPVTIGATHGGSYSFIGEISNVRIIKGRALYTAAFTPPSTALTATDDTVLLTCQDATVRDNSNIGHDVTASGDVAVVNEGPFNGYSGSFDGSGDYLNVAETGSEFTFGTGDFTIEFWTYRNNTNQTIYFDWRNGYGSQVGMPVIYSYNSELRYFLNSADRITATDISANTWHHIALCRSGTSTKMFVNGTQAGSTLSDSTTYVSPQGTEGIYIGAFGGGSYDLNGYISNFRVIKGQALYTSDFTPPTADLTTTSQGATASNVKLLTCQDSTFIDNSASAHSITANGDAHTVSVNPHTDKYSVTFDGTGDYLSIANNTDHQFGGNDYTIESWVYLNNLSTTHGLFGRYKTFNNDREIYITLNTNGSITHRTSSDGSAFSTHSTSAGLLTANTWHHVAISKSGTNSYIAVDGVVESGTVDSTLNTASQTTYIGDAVAGYNHFNGKLSNFRITKGQALYTSNFLPSKEDFTTTSQGATASNVKLLTCQDYKIQDNSASAHTITVNGDAKPSTDAPFVTSGAGSFDGTGDYLNTVADADFNFGTGAFSVEMWMYPTATPGSFDSILLGSNPTASGIFWGSRGAYLDFVNQNDNYTLLQTTYPTINRWTHVAVCRDSSGTMRLFKDGVLQASATSNTDNYSQTEFQIGGSGTYTFTGYISNFRYSKGYARYTAAFTPPTEDFDPTDQDTTFLALQGNTLDDLSGNDHAVTANGDAATTTVSPFEPVDGSDAMLDSPTNYGSGDTVRGNYCTLNPIDLLGSGVTLSEGNLKFVTTASAVHRRCRGTIFVSSGKWYAEATLNTVGGTYPNFGIITNTSNNSDTYIGGDSESYGYNSNGNKSNNGSGTAYGATYTAGDTIGAALDLDAGTVVFYKNGVSQGTAYSSLSGLFTFGISGFGSSATWTLNFGQQPFKYPQSGYKSLCSTNLPTPAVADGSTAMDVALYTGDGQTTQTVALPFEPGLTWQKMRSGSSSHYLHDAIRGFSASYGLRSNGTNAEGVNSAYYSLSQSGSNLTVGDVGAGNEWNTNGSNYVIWTWDAGSSTVSNTDGSITSQVRANPSAGFSIVTAGASGYFGGSVGHGLGVPPEFILAKDRNTTYGWRVYHKSTGNNFFFNLTTGAVADYGSNLWNVTSSVFGSYAGVSGSTLVAYCFAPVEGFSSFGSYTGNGNTDGPFVYTGFRPRWILFKRTDAANNWFIVDTERDSYNDLESYLSPDLPDDEDTAADIADAVSNGFKIRGGPTYYGFNATGGTYIYAAFAEHPFKTSRAR